MNETGSKTLSLEFETDAALEAAREAVAAGQCVVFPTDTVYGIGCAAFDTNAVTGLLDAKKRGRDMPPPVLIAEGSMLRALAGQVPEAARKLVAQFWPGALTIIVKAQRSLPLDLGETRGTVAVRVPDHDEARALLRHGREFSKRLRTACRDHCWGGPRHAGRCCSGLPGRWEGSRGRGLHDHRLHQ